MTKLKCLLMSTTLLGVAIIAQASNGPGNNAVQASAPQSVACSGSINGQNISQTLTFPTGTAPQKITSADGKVSIVMSMYMDNPTLNGIKIIGDEGAKLGVDLEVEDKNSMPIAESKGLSLDQQIVYSYDDGKKGLNITCGPSFQ